MSYQLNGNYNAQSNVNGGYPTRGGQGNGIPAATHGHSVQHAQALHQRPHIPFQQPPILHQPPQVHPQQVPAPRPTRAPPAPPIHFVLDRQYTLCRAPSPPAHPAPRTQYAPGPPMRGALHYTAVPPVPHYTPARDGAHYTPARDGAHYTPPRSVPHHTPGRDGSRYAPPRDGPHYAQTPSNGARYVPPALRNVPQYTPAPHTPYAPAPAPALIPFRCAHPQCAGRVVMVASAREHMWAAHRVRI